MIPQSPLSIHNSYIALTLFSTLLSIPSLTLLLRSTLPLSLFPLPFPLLFLNMPLYYLHFLSYFLFPLSTHPSIFPYLVLITIPFHTFSSLSPPIPPAPVPHIPTDPLQLLPSLQFVAMLSLAKCVTVVVSAEGARTQEHCHGLMLSLAN